MTFEDDRRKKGKKKKITNKKGRDEDGNDSGILTQWEMDIFFSIKNQHKCIKSSH